MIARISGESAQTVTQRLWEEEKCLGLNVRRDLVAFGLKPHVWSDQLLEFYSQTHAFMYETTVWNRTPLKCQLREWIIQYLQSDTNQPLKILCFGDGLGFDSTAMAQAGHVVTYFEPSLSCQEFAKSVFAANQVAVRTVQSPLEFQGELFDVVLSLDVLEHVPDPSGLVQTFTQWLKPNGLLIAHSPFFLVSHYYSTHLKSNQQYSGDWKLYQQQGLHPIAGRMFGEPLVLQKTTSPPSIPLPLRCGSWLLSLGRGSLNGIHCQVARFMSRRDPRWQRDLEQRLSRYCENSLPAKSND